MGRVVELAESPAGRRLRIDPGGLAGPFQEGESIAVSGCCLTLVGTETPLTFDVVGETLARTTIGGLSAGDRVNLERSVRPETLMGGHIVQGHVDGVGEVVRVQDDPQDWRLTLRSPADLLPCIVPKGSVTVEGVSLTIARVEGDILEIALIPTTLERTTLGALASGDRCNIETDIVARTVVHWLGRQQS